MDAQLRMLVRHELRLALRAVAWRNAAGVLGLVGVFFVLMHLFAWSICLALPRGAPSSAEGQIAIGIVVLIAMSCMLLLAVTAWVEALFTRGDLDLLLSAPVRPAKVLIARTVAVAASILGTLSIFILPFANVGVLMRRYWLAGLYVSLPVGALLVTAAALLIALFMVRALGTRRARLVLQVLGACLGVGFYFASQSFANLLPALFKEDGVMPAASDVGAALTAFVRADPLALLIALLLTAAIAWLAWVRLERELVHAAQPATGPGKGTSSSLRDGAAFKAGLWRATLRKEARCIRRDPLLLSQLTLPLIYLTPTAWSLLQAGRSAASLPLLAGMLVLFAGSLAMTLCALVLNMDDAPELAYANAQSLPPLILNKAAAAATLAFIPGVLLACLMAWRISPMLLFALPFVAIGVTIAALLVAANVTVRPRNEFAKRKRSLGLDVSFVIIALLMLTSGAAGAAMTSYWPVGIVLAALALAFPLKEIGAVRALRSPAQLWREAS
jgi:ABC-2 type transport system permease protein